MTKNVIIVTLAVLAVALVTVTAVYAAYPSGIGGMMNQQQGNGYNNAYGQMTAEQCRTQAQNMHGSGFGGSMMGNFDHDAMHNGTMNYNGTTSAPSGTMGRGGCH